jgi:hypothetical protein
MFSRYLLFFLLIPCVTAVGISPPAAQVDFIPGHTYEFEVRVINFNDFPVKMSVRAEGEFKDSFGVRTPIKVPANGATIVPVSFTLPDSLSRPGYHTSYLYFKEEFDEFAGGTFPIRTEVGFKATVWQPYPGSYAELVVSAASVGEGNDTGLNVVVNNLGTDPIEEGKVTVALTSATGELKDVFTIPNINLEGNSNEKFSQRISSSSYAPGRYNLEGKLFYGDKIAAMNGSFVVGTQNIEIIALEGPFYLDKPVNRFALHVESLWNLPLENVYATVKLGSRQTQTPSNTLGPFARGALDGYWETDTTIGPGERLAHVVVYFPGGQSEQLVPITVYNETPKAPALEFESPSPVIEISAADLIFMGIALILVVCIVVFAFQRVNKREPKEPIPPQ